MADSEDMALEPVFFELSWSILSTIGMANVFFGLLVVSVTGFSLIAAVPLVASAACALANGLCFYAYYLTGPPATNRAVASGFADIFWLIQEASLSMYSYLILRRILHRTPWFVFAGLFWVIMLAIVNVRIMIIVMRVRFILRDDNELQKTVNHLHMGYFPLIAVLECVSAYFLLTTFARAKISGVKRATKLSLFHYLMRSTEVRLALLAVVGTMRAITYSFQTSAQSATHLPSQIDRFCYTLECLFPVIMYIDMLSSKVVYSNQNRDISLGGRVHGSLAQHLGGSGKDRGNITVHGGRREHIVEMGAGADLEGAETSSQERIVGGDRGVDTSDMTLADVELSAVVPCRTR